MGMYLDVQAVTEAAGRLEQAVRNLASSGATPLTKGWAQSVFMESF